MSGCVNRHSVGDVLGRGLHKVDGRVGVFLRFFFISLGTGTDRQKKFQSNCSKAGLCWCPKSWGEIFAASNKGIAY